MNGRSFERLRRMPREEIAWRTRQTVRTGAQRLVAHVAPPRWHREGIRAALAPSVRDSLTNDGAWLGVHGALARRIRGRAARFPLEPSSEGLLRARILARWPGAAEHAAARGIGILAGRYDLLGYRGLTFGKGQGAPDWHFDPVHNRRAPVMFWADVPYLDPSCGDHKIIWELNRHQHWLQLGRASWLTGDVRYGHAIVAQLDSWLAANPPYAGTNWASMLEVALRALSWTWALHFLIDGASERDEHPWLVDMLVALDAQLTHVERNLSLYFSPNTHLTGEALGLYVVGLALPELAASARWADVGRRVLLSEIARQIHPDGGHVERSTHYHRYTLDFYLMALLSALGSGDDAAVPPFTEAVSRLAEYARAMADDQGRLPLIGDDDGGMLWPIAGRECPDVRDSLALAGVLLDRPDLAPWGVQEEVYWAAGCRAAEYDARQSRSPRSTAAVRSRTFPETGYVVSRDASGNHAVLDVGLHGYLNGGHAHADALAVTLTLAGRPLLIDPGTSTYTLDRRVRDLLRSSTSHNTLTIGDRSQATPSGPFHWQDRADGRLHGWRHNRGFDWAEASHDAYTPVRHRRTLVRITDAGCLVVDEVLGAGTLSAATHWHFDPGWRVRSDGQGRLLATHVEGDEAWLLHDAGDAALVHGDEGSGLGWFAPVYGTLVPTWTARLMRNAEAPFAMATWIESRSRHAAGAPVMERVKPAGPRSAIGVQIVDGSRRSVFLLCPGTSPRTGVSQDAAPGYQTDARMLHYALEGERLIALDLVDARHARSLHDGWISVAAPEPLADLHLGFTDGVLAVHGSDPPSQLRLQGESLRSVRSLRLNDREVPASRTDRSDTLIVLGVDWGDPDRRLVSRSASSVVLVSRT